MSFEKLNSVGGFSVGIPAIDVVAGNGIVVADINANIVQANIFQYANGQPISGSAAGSNTQIQFNNGNSTFGASSAFTFDTTTSLLSITNISASGNVSLGNVANLTITGGSDGYYLQTDGTGNLSWAAGGGGGNGSPGGSNSQVQFNDAGLFGGKNTFEFNKATDTLSVTNIVATNITGTVSSAITAGTVTASAQPNITSVGTLGNLNVSGTVSAAILSGSGAGLTNVPASSIIGTVPLATNVQSSSQPNITSVGTMVSLSATGNITTSSYFVGNGAFLTGISGGTSITNGNSNVVVQNNANVTISSTGNANVVIVTGTGANITGTLSVSGNANVGNIGTVGLITSTGNITGGNLITSGLITATGNIRGGNLVTTGSLDVSGNVSLVGANITLGSVSNLHISGGTSGYYLQTDGAGNLTWAAGGGGGGGTPGGSNTQVQFNDAGNFGGVANLTYDKVTDTLQVTGEITANTFQMGVGSSRLFNQTVYFATTSSTSPNQVLWSVPATSVLGVDFVIVSTDATGNTRQSAKISSIVLGTAVAFNEYAGLGINGGVGSFSVDYGNSRVELYVTPDSNDLTEYNILITEYLNNP